MRILYFAFLCLVYLFSNVSNAADFPVVKNTSAKFDILVSDTPYFLSFPIENNEGRELYWLLCFSGTDKALDRFSSESDINFVGPFACRLSTENERLSEKTLLAGQPNSAYWHTRGAFDFGELEEPCGSYSEFGKVRNFELRGFKLTLAVSNLKLSDQTSSFTLDVEVVTDKSATTPFAKPISIPPPKWVNGKCKLPN